MGRIESQFSAYYYTSNIVIGFVYIGSTIITKYDICLEIVVLDLLANRQDLSLILYKMIILSLSLCGKEV